MKAGQTSDGEFVAHVKSLKTKLMLGGTRSIVDAIVWIGLHVVELRARVRNLEERTNRDGT